MERDPERMCRMIRATRKPCLTFKVFGAGRTSDSAEEREIAVQFALSKVKPTDAIIVGMYPRFTDQVKENADLFRRVLSV